MKIEDYHAKIALFYEANPQLSHEELAVVLTADRMYKEAPGDLLEFRKKYAHLDPGILRKSNGGITFLKIAESRGSGRVLKERLNDYLNVKLHDIKQKKGYETNAKLFQEKSFIASRALEEILHKAAFPKAIVDVLKEHEEVRSCYDFYEMLRLYRGAKTERLRYEILRKIGLVVLIARINRTVAIEELEDRKKEVWQAFHRGLRKAWKDKKEYYLWLNAKHKVEFSTDERQARRAYAREVKTRRNQACRIHPLQKFTCRPFTTASGNTILHMEIRNKFGKKENPSYASYIEKMVRKNLEFPNQIHDTIGVKIVMEKEARIEEIIQDLETFLGGSSTRKMEKNSYHRFGRRRLSEYSSPEYFVWKAIYDITLPHPSISQIRKVLRLTRGNQPAQQELRKRLDYFANHPRDFVIEVQIQDVKSYLLSIARGSPTDHGWLKMNQIRSNSFYKFFPREIYEQEIRKMKLDLLGRPTT